MTSESTTRWPLPQERAPLATETHRVRGYRLTRSAWLLTGLAFVCGGLVSAAAFSIGWRHQAQRDTAARAALAGATARVHKLERQLDTARATAAREQASAAAAAAAERALAATGTRVAGEAIASSGSAGAISSRVGSLTAAASRLASELKTLDTYLSTTPTAQLDPGYITSQTAYLAQQLTRLQADAGNLGGSVASFEASVRKLTRDAAALKSR
jgi:Tfp pilus assembly protein FimV